LRSQWLCLGQQGLQLTVAGARVEHLVLQKWRQCHQIPAPEPDVAACLAVPAADQAFAIENEKDLFGLAAWTGMRLPGGLVWIDIVKAVAGIAPRRSA